MKNDNSDRRPSGSHNNAAIQSKSNMAQTSFYDMRDRELKNMGMLRPQPFSLYGVDTRQFLKGLVLRLCSKLTQIFLFNSIHTAGEALRNMPAYYLKDIGLTMSDVDALLLGRKANYANDNKSAAANRDTAQVS